MGIFPTDKILEAILLKYERQAKPDLSLLIASNIPIKYIQTQMGHASIQMTMDTYGHILPEVTQQGVNALDNLLHLNKKHTNKPLKIAK